MDGVYELETLTPDRVAARRLGSVLVGGVATPVAVEKTFRFGGSRLKPALELATSVENRGPVPVAFELAVEWNVNLLGGGHNPAAYYETADSTRAPHDVAGEAPSAAHLAFGRVYQGSSLLFRWPVSLAPGEHATFTVSLAASQTIDHSADEAG